MIWLCELHQTLNGDVRLMAIACARGEELAHHLTTHSTGAELAWLLSRTRMLFLDSSRPVNSGVRCCAAGDNLN